MLLILRFTFCFLSITYALHAMSSWQCHSPLFLGHRSPGGSAGSLIQTDCGLSDHYGSFHVAAPPRRVAGTLFSRYLLASSPHASRSVKTLAGLFSPPFLSLRRFHPEAKNISPKCPHRTTSTRQVTQRLACKVGAGTCRLVFSSTPSRATASGD